MVLVEERVEDFLYPGWQMKLMTLLVLVEKGEPVHGYYVYQTLEAMFGLDKAQSTYYRRLVTLVSEGVLEVVECDNPTERMRGDYYQVTEQGHAWLVEQLPIIVQLLKLVVGVLHSGTLENITPLKLLDSAWCQRFVILKWVQSVAPISSRDMCEQAKDADAPISETTLRRYINSLISGELIHSVEVQHDDDPRLKFYELTEAGQTWLRGAKEDVQLLLRGVIS